MAENYIRYSLITPRGTIDFNVGEEGYRLTNVSELDSPMLRTTTENIPQKDGAISFPAYRGSRSPTLEGQIIVRGDNLADRVALEDNLRGCAMSLLRETGTLRFWPSDGSVRELNVRLREPLQIKSQAGVIKDFLLALVAADPNIYEATPRVLRTPPLASTGTPIGSTFTFPLTSQNFTFGNWENPGRVVIHNAGNETTYPIVKIYGQFTGMKVTNETTGAVMNFPTLEVPSGSFAELDMFNETVRYNGLITEPLLDKMDITTSDFFYLVPGDNMIRFEATTVGSVPDLNMFANPGFEVNTTNWTQVGLTAITRVTDRSRSGVASARLGPVTVESGNYVYTNAFQINGPSAGREYRFSVWFFGEGTAVGKHINIMLREQGGGMLHRDHNSVHLITAGWQAMSGTMTIVENDRTQIQPFIYGVVPGGTPIPVGAYYWIDDARLEETDPEFKPWAHGEVRWKSAYA
jgi:hypothetical protein